MPDVIVVAGAAGFIGSNFTRTLLRKSDARLVLVDNLSYAGNRLNLEGIANHPRCHFEQANIADPEAMARILEDYRPWALVNLAAETHVDRSIDDPSPFIQANLVGTSVLLEAARDYLKSGTAALRARFRFVQVSTDEVYGTLGMSGCFTESSAFTPNSPYAASKAGADHLARAYVQTYGLPVLITHGSNTYGPFQFPEKLIPLMILNALEGAPLPVYGDGRQVRDWLHVEDHCEGILAVLHKGKVGERYNLGGRCERANLEVIEAVCQALEEFRPAAANAALVSQGKRGYAQLKAFVPDRPGHDRRYAMDPSKAEQALRWFAARPFEEGIRCTVGWYLDHLDWCAAVQDGKYKRQRMGLPDLAQVGR